MNLVQLNLRAMIKGNLVRRRFPLTIIEINCNMDALLPSVGSKWPKRLRENVMCPGKPKGKESETKIPTLSLKTRRTSRRTGVEEK